MRTCPENIAALDDSRVGADLDDLQTKFLAKYLTNDGNLIVQHQTTSVILLTAPSYSFKTTLNYQTIPS